MDALGGLASARAQDLAWCRNWPGLFAKNAAYDDTSQPTTDGLFLAKPSATQAGLAARAILMQQGLIATP